MSQARQSDTKAIKPAILKFIPQDYLPLDENSNTPANAYQFVMVQNPDTSKTWRGWGNCITAQLLCPVDHVPEFEANPER